jgi:hypothetical protein
VLASTETVGVKGRFALETPARSREESNVNMGGLVFCAAVLVTILGAVGVFGDRALNEVIICAAWTFLVGFGLGQIFPERKRQ